MVFQFTNEPPEETPPYVLGQRLSEVFISLQIWLVRHAINSNVLSLSVEL